MFLNKKNNDTNINITLKYLLSYILTNMDKLTYELSKSYPKDNVKVILSAGISTTIFVLLSEVVYPWPILFFPYLET